MKFDGCLLYVQDIEKSLEFFRDALGLPVKSRPATHFAIIDGGTSVIYLHEDPKQKRGKLQHLDGQEFRGLGVILHFEVTDVFAIRDRLVEKNIDISYGPVDQPFGQCQMYVYDPDGYNIVIMHRIHDEL